MPRVTVLMPVYNNANYLQQAIDSILSQTFDDFEFIIIDDASTDETSEIIKNNSDSRINYFQNKRNLGVALTLNRGLELAKGEYIARFDGDDISYPTRLERQVDYMERHSDTGVVGSWYKLIWTKHRQVTIHQPWGSSSVKATLCFRNPVCHSAAMIRKSVLEEHNLRYNNEFNRSEDYDLWIRISEFAELDNLPEVLLKVRVRGDSVISSYPEQTKQQTYFLLQKELYKIGIDTSETEIKFHNDIGQGKRQAAKSDIIKAGNWLLKLYKQNEKSRYYDPSGMEKALALIWFKLCSNSGNVGFFVWRYWKLFVLSQHYKPSSEELMVFALSIVWNGYFRRVLNKIVSS